MLSAIVPGCGAKKENLQRILTVYIQSHTHIARTGCASLLTESRETGQTLLERSSGSRQEGERTPDSCSEGSETHLRSSARARLLGSLRKFADTCERGPESGSRCIYNG